MGSPFVHSMMLALLLAFIPIATSTLSCSGSCLFDGTCHKGLCPLGTIKLLLPFTGCDFLCSCCVSPEVQTTTPTTSTITTTMMNTTTAPTTAWVPLCEKNAKCVNRGGRCSRSDCRPGEKTRYGTQWCKPKDPNTVGCRCCF
ncbi:unnamed protein product [Meganyctiphanes norvegica]|uniref:Uncharacterized protein n=1 Tax=Meganyctiphanes norvegica TaxID=48144 RepID=A0AAV2SAZ9_MEGNR